MRRFIAAASRFLVVVYTHAWKVGSKLRCQCWIVLQTLCQGVDKKTWGLSLAEHPCAWGSWSPSKHHAAVRQSQINERYSNKPVCTDPFPREMVLFLVKDVFTSRAILF